MKHKSVVLPVMATVYTHLPEHQYQSMFDLQAFLNNHSDEIRKLKLGRAGIASKYNIKLNQARRVLQALGLTGDMSKSRKVINREKRKSSAKQKKPIKKASSKSNPTHRSPENFRDPKRPLTFDDQNRMVHTYLGSDYGVKTLTYDQYSELLKDYSIEWGGTMLNQDQIAAKYKFPNAHAVAMFLGLHGIRHTSIPFTDWEMAGVEPTEAARMAAESWKQKYFEQAQKQRFAVTEASARKWNAFEASALELLNSHQVKSAPIPPRINLKARRLFNYALVLAPKDLHWGKLTYDAAGQVNYNRDIARERLVNSTEDLLAQALAYGNPERIYLVVGSDGIHVDTPWHTTTKGTRQNEMDGTWVTILDSYVDLIVSQVLHVCQFSEVTLIIEPGNHDFATITMLGLLLERTFKDNPRVQIMRRPTEPRIYTTYGDNTLCFLHGNDVNVERKLPQLFLAEAHKQGVELRGNRIAFSGHLHHDRQIDLGGVDLVIVPSLTPSDSWHKAGGYVGAREQATAYVIHEHDGKRAVFYSRRY